MTQFFVDQGRNYYLDYVGSHAIVLAYVTAIRDQFRAVLEIPTSGNDFRVSDIIFWNGTGGSATYRGYAFTIRFLDGAGGFEIDGHKHELLFIFGGRQDTAASTGVSNILQSIVTANTYFHDFNVSTDALSDTTGMPVLIHYNSMAGSDGVTFNGLTGYQMQFDTASTASNTGGAAKLITTNTPFSAISTFMGTAAAAEVLGLSFSTINASNPYQACYIFDNNQSYPHMGIFLSNGREMTLYGHGLLGSCLQNRIESDPYKQFSLSTTFTNTSSNIGQVATQRANARDQLGTRAGYTLGPASAEVTILTPGNSPRPSDGAYAWLEVPLFGTTYTKGEIYQDIYRTMGGYNRDHQRLFSTPSGAMIKTARGQSTSWAANQGPFPGPPRSYRAGSTAL